jgi:hypothetical protein
MTAVMMIRYAKLRQSPYQLKRCIQHQSSTMHADFIRRARVEKYLSQREKPFTNFVCVFVRANPNETLINPRQYSSFDRWF